MYLTEKQIQIMSTVIRANTDGSFLDMDQLVEKVPYNTTKESMQFSLRALIKKEMLDLKPREVRRGRLRKVIAPTVTGMESMKLR